MKDNQLLLVWQTTQVLHFVAVTPAILLTDINCGLEILNWIVCYNHPRRVLDCTLSPTATWVTPEQACSVSSIWILRWIVVEHQNITCLSTNWVGVKVTESEKIWCSAASSLAKIIGSKHSRIHKNRMKHWVCQSKCVIKWFYTFS